MSVSAPWVGMTVDVWWLDSSWGTAVTVATVSAADRPLSEYWWVAIRLQCSDTSPQINDGLWQLPVLPLRQVAPPCDWLLPLALLPANTMPTWTAVSLTSWQFKVYCRQCLTTAPSLLASFHSHQFSPLNTPLLRVNPVEKFKLVKQYQSTASYSTTVRHEFIIIPDKVGK